jgi:hypothetical protein
MSPGVNAAGLMPREMVGKAAASALSVAPRGLARHRSLRACGDGTFLPGRTGAAMGTLVEPAGDEPGSRTGRTRPGNEPRAGGGSGGKAEKLDGSWLGGGLYYPTG